MSSARTRKLLARIAIVGIGITLIAGCAAVVGLDGYEIVPCEEGASCTNSPDGSSNNSDGSPSNVDGNLPSTSKDGGGDERPPDPPCSTVDASCSPTPPPAGWTNVIVTDDPDTFCPSGHTQVSVIREATAQAGSCVCNVGACNANVDCQNGNIQISRDTGGGNCNQGAGNFQGSNTCANLGLSESTDHVRFEPPPAQINGCTMTATPATDKITFDRKNLCTFDPSTCAGFACPALGAKQHACLATDGDVPLCPINLPNRFLVGADSTVSCPTCACNATATCTGRAQLWESNNCSGAADTTVDAGACVALANGHDDKSRARWVGAVASVSCVAQAAPVATVTLSGPKTICCP